MECYLSASEISIMDSHFATEGTSIFCSHKISYILCSLAVWETSWTTTIVIHVSVTSISIPLVDDCGYW